MKKKTLIYGAAVLVVIMAAIVIALYRQRPVGLSTGAPVYLSTENYNEGRIIQIQSSSSEIYGEEDFLYIDVIDRGGSVDRFKLRADSKEVEIFKLAFQTESLCKYNRGTDTENGSYIDVKSVEIQRQLPGNIATDEYWYNSITNTDLAIKIDALKDNTNTIRNYLYWIWRYVWYIYSKVR